MTQTPYYVLRRPDRQDFRLPASTGHVLSIITVIPKPQFGVHTEIAVMGDDLEKPTSIGVYTKKQESNHLNLSMAARLPDDCLKEGSRTLIKVNAEGKHLRIENLSNDEIQFQRINGKDREIYLEPRSKITVGPESTFSLLHSGDDVMHQFIWRSTEGHHINAEAVGKMLSNYSLKEAKGLRQRVQKLVQKIKTNYRKLPPARQQK